MRWCITYVVGRRINAYLGRDGASLGEAYEKGTNIIKREGGVVLAITHATHAATLLPLLLLEVTNPANQPRSRPRLVKE